MNCEQALAINDIGIVREGEEEHFRDLAMGEVVVEEVGGLAWDDLDEKNLNEKMKKAALQGVRLLKK